MFFMSIDNAFHNLLPLYLIDFFLSQSEQYEYESHVFALYYENGQIHFLQSICEKQPVVCFYYIRSNA